RSIRTTLLPARAASTAAVYPPGPPPSTATSASIGMNGSLRILSSAGKGSLRFGIFPSLDGFYFTFFFAGNQTELDRMDRIRRKRYHVNRPRGAWHCEECGSAHRRPAAAGDSRPGGGLRLQ